MSIKEQVYQSWHKANAATSSLRAAALRDPVLFSQTVLRDEYTGGPITLAPMHIAWHDLITEHDRVVVWSHVEGGKTSQIACGRVLYELGKNPNLRVAIISNTASQAEKILRNVSRYIERSAELRLITGLKPGSQWKSNAITIDRESNAKDPSVQACGAFGSILGSRIDLLIVDDILDFENTLTKAQRQKVISWFQSDVVGRLTGSARVVIIGNAFYPDDLLHNLAQTPGYTAVRYPVIVDDPASPAYGMPRWPERWPLERIEKAKQEMGPSEFARKMLCQARDDAQAKFKWEYIQSGLRRGNGKTLCGGLGTIPAGFRTITGVDLAVSKADGADLTVLFTIAVRPANEGEIREVLDIQSGRWSGPDIINRIMDAHKRYHSTIIVENNAAQDFIVQFARAAGPGIPIKAFTTGRNKAHPEFGVEGMATELNNGQWSIPNIDGQVHPEVRAWIDEMLYYDPAAHTGDRLMASWFAREGIRISGIKAESGYIDWNRR